MNYEDRIVVFIDILGFGDIVRNTVDDGNDVLGKIDELNNILLLIREIFDIDALDEVVAKSKRITQFSDSIVISFLVTERSEVFYTLVDIQHLIINLVCRGVLCRGGIAYGKLVHTENVVFGPGLNQAYETESKAALYPRIVLDETVVGIGEAHHALHHDAGHEREYIMETVTKDTDDMYFIDYFGKAQSELDDPQYDMPEYMESLRRIIMSNLDSEKPDLRVKYGWVKNKFNELVKSLKDPTHLFALRDNGDDELVDYYEKLEEI